MPFAFSCSGDRSPWADLLRPASNLPSADLLRRPEPLRIWPEAEFGGAPNLTLARSSSSDLPTAPVPTRPEPVFLNSPDGEATALPALTGPDPVLSRPEPVLPGVPASAAATLPTLSGLSGAVVISNLVFSGLEGSTGTFQIQLAQAPTTNVTVTFTAGNFLVVDADANARNGTQSSLTFTPQDWNQLRLVSFLAEVDGTSADRTTGNTISYSLSGGVQASGNYNLGTIVNTYVPDTNRFNIDLDFRNDYLGFWTPERRAVAQKAANDWAIRIANEWNGLQLNSSINQLQSGVYSDITFLVRRYVDDLLIFVNPIDSGGTAGGYGSPDYAFGGWITSPELMPRVGQIAIDPAVGDFYLYNAVAHEIGHVLGLVGLNWAGYLQQDFATPQTAVFRGAYSTAANGGQFIPLQSQDGPNSVSGQYDYWHPANRVPSIMSYGYLYTLSSPTAIDYALLADSGYRIYGINA